MIVWECDTREIARLEQRLAKVLRATNADARAPFVVSATRQK
jgi:G:T-mismatch repair DNA endonuclease (very short patch repair protein)